MINQSNPKQIWYPTSSHEITETWNNLNGKIRLFTVKIYTQNGNKFGLPYKLWDYFVLSIKVTLTPNHGVTFINILCKSTSKDYFYLKNKFQEVMEKNTNVLHTEMQGYYNKFKYWN